MSCCLSQLDKNKIILKFILFILILYGINAFPQSERLTRGLENGYAWLAMDDPALMYSTSRQNYLSSILDRIKLTNEKYPHLTPLGCREEIAQLSKQGKSDDISLNDVVYAMDRFYSQKDNLIIPIVFAYCYTIKKYAGVSPEELEIYRNEVLLFCYE